VTDRTRKQEVPSLPKKADVWIDDRIAYVGRNDADCVAWLKRHDLAGIVKEWQPWR
jgi:hypothetical protein